MTAPRTWRMSCARLEGLLISARDRAGLTQVDVAKRVGVSLSTFKRWELGCAEPRLRQLFRWADIVGVSIEALLADQSVRTDTTRSLAHGFALPVQGDNEASATFCHVEQSGAFTPALGAVQ